MTFQNILDDYNSKKNDKHIEHCEKQTNLSSAIYFAACAVDYANNIHPHQKRVGYECSKKFAQHLIQYEDEINDAKDFEELLKIVSQYRIHRIGDLALYDTAERIGVYRGMRPTKIYLHCGSREGAVNLLGNLKGKKALCMTDLPQMWQNAGLKPYQVENIFCIYKKHLHPNLK